MSGNGRGGGKTTGTRAANPPRRQATAREVAFESLLRVAKEGAYSNLQLKRALQEAGLSRTDAGLATELVYGTLQRQKTLDYWLGQFVAKGTDKLQDWVLVLLRMSLYQLAFLDRIPAHAAVHEAVQIAKKRGHQGISGMVNGVLRSADRRRGELTLPDGGDAVGRISLRHSYPEWLVKRWIDTYGEETAEAICAAGNEPPRMSLRVNRLRADRDEVLAQLQEAGCKAEHSAAAPWGITVERGGSLIDAEEYREGKWTIQDESSMLVAEAAAPEAGMQVLDCCAAPGGKSTHLAEIMQDRGIVWANDIHPHKEALIAEQAQRLGLTCIRTTIGDAAEPDDRYAAESMDLVLLDAPCSGFGVIRRKPEIKWTKSPQDVAAIAEIQHKLLETAAALLRPGGVMIYSTCTIERTENEEQIRRFLEKHPAFSLDREWPAAVLEPLKRSGIIDDGFTGAVQLLPQHFGSDGFFIARLRKQP